MEISFVYRWLADLHWSHKRHVKPESQAVHQAWVHHVELKGNLYPETQKKREGKSHINTIVYATYI